MINCCCIGIKDVDGVDLGYKLVRKENLAKPLYENSNNLIRGGELWAWGIDCSGMIGNNTYVGSPYWWQSGNKIKYSSPVQTIAGGTNWKSIAVTNSRALVATKTDGTLWTWGSGCRGQLGDNSTVSKSSPVQTSSGGTNWKQASPGPRSMAAVKTDGTMWFWGSSYNGMLFNTPTGFCETSIPVQSVAGGTCWKQVSLHGTSRYSAAVAAIKCDGSLWVWGCCFCNSGVPRAAPLDVADQNGIKWCDVRPGQNAVVALKEDGSMWTWGNKNFTTTGSPNFGNFQRSADGGSDWKSLQKSGTANTMVALKRDRSAWAWGYMSFLFGIYEYAPTGGFFYYARQLYGTPVSVQSGRNSWLCLHPAEASTNVLGIKSDGTLWAWGSQDFIPRTCMGYDCKTFINDTLSPTQIGNSSGWKDIAAYGCLGFGIKE